MRASLITREVNSTHIYKQSPCSVNIHLDQWIYVLSFFKHFGEWFYSHFMITQANGKHKNNIT